MTTNHEIPFTEARPTEAGLYLWRLHKLDNDPIMLNVEVRDDGELYDVRSTSPLYYAGEYSCKLIPSTALDEAKRRVEELEADLKTSLKELIDVNQFLLELSTTDSGVFFEVIDKLLLAQQIKHPEIFKQLIP